MTRADAGDAGDAGDASSSTDQARLGGIHENENPRR